MPKWSFAIAWIAIGYYLWNLGGDIYALIPEFQPGTLWRSYRGLTLVLYVITAGLVWVFGLLRGLSLWNPPLRLANQVNKYGQAVLEKAPRWFRNIFVGVLLILPAWLLLFSSFAYETVGIYLRLFILMVSAAIISHIIYPNLSLQRREFAYFCSFMMVTAVFFAGSYLTNVSAYPFSIGWSEGNRLWDYSIWAGSDRYLYEGSQDILVSISLGKKWLFGLPYLIPGIDIFGVRLWDATVKIFPAFFLGFFLVSKKDEHKTGWLGKVILGSWTFLFLLQGPIQVPLVVSALLVVLALRMKNLPIASLVVMLAGYYASISRWTWAYAPGLWVGMLALMQIEEPKLKLRDWHKLKRPIILGISGYIGGQFLRDLIRGLSSDILSQTRFTLFRDLSNLEAFGQPLLWERLLPNPTFPVGILLALVFVTIPLGVWWYIAHKYGGWHLNRLQVLGIFIPMLAFLTVGLVASVKIGGGADLHNLDMFLIGLMLVASLSWPKIIGLLRGGSKSVMLLIIAYTALLMPVFYKISAPGPLVNPPMENTTATLAVIRDEIAKAKTEGDILFMDQRQLLTFGHIDDVVLISEYEKKWVMDQAMSGNSAYFNDFYTDLSNHRFSLIISERLFFRIGDTDKPFPEENDAWVKWVSLPLLQYYRVWKDFKIVGVQLLVPRE